MDFAAGLCKPGLLYLQDFINNNRELGVLELCISRTGGGTPMKCLY
jgi:hypothetical protein